ncbi:dual specificity protein phosphatase CDC14B-like [Leptopilina heterotoma]|uniref:dual specificity protein phosphatase CDC14B-like n=1 Tax=Leptopilina heterotoma TaxID=63436 RepID=UPI001CA89E46|nr:dual specificity protein phosphatase CDC14B-like [Leptopilina heterotoma]
MIDKAPKLFPNRFCNILRRKLKNPDNWCKQIVYYTSEDGNKMANAAFLISSFAVIFLEKTPSEIDKILVSNNVILKPFPDASHTENLTLTLLDCLNGMKKALKCGFFNFQDFNLLEYEKYSQMRNGDLNWIIPRKFIGFVGPSTKKDTNYHPPEKYFNYFVRNGVEAIIRLNRKCYDASRFKKIGIKHYNLYMPDGTAPTRRILEEFLEICENNKGAIAVHCKAGLGRTGTLIAAYIIKHYRLNAREAIAWVRICRPGSIIAPQQKWLEEIESLLQRAGHFYRRVDFQKYSY